MIGVSLIRISYASNKWLMAQIFGGSDSSGLCLVIIIRDTRSVRVFQNIVCDGTTFWTALGLWFDINVCHDKSPVVGFEL
jgi:hypothetical protein